MIICDKCKKENAMNVELAVGGKDEEDVYAIDLCESCFTLFVAAMSAAFMGFVGK